MNALKDQFRSTLKPKAAQLQRQSTRRAKAQDEAYAFHMATRTFNFASEEQYMSAAERLCELANVIAKPEKPSATKQLWKAVLRVVKHHP